MSSERGDTTVKAIAALLVSCFCIGNAAAAEYGVGISAKSDNGLVYVPIDISPKFRVEPYIRYSTDDTTSLKRRRRRSRSRAGN